jgi:hypothetical protein
MPLLNRKFRLDLMSVRLGEEAEAAFRYIQADVPAKKTNAGAQKWVIQRVKNKRGVVVARSVGLCVAAVTCNRSRE